MLNPIAALWIRLFSGFLDNWDPALELDEEEILAELEYGRG